MVIKKLFQRIFFRTILGNKPLPRNHYLKVFFCISLYFAISSIPAAMNILISESDDAMKNPLGTILFIATVISFFLIPLTLWLKIRKNNRQAKNNQS